MGRLIVRNITNTKKSIKSQHRHWLKYNVKGAISFFQLLFQIFEYLWWYTNIRNGYIYGYFRQLWTDFDQTKIDFVI